MSKPRVVICMILPAIIFLASVFFITNQKDLSIAKARVEVRDKEISSTGLAEFGDVHLGSFNRVIPVDFLQRIVSDDGVGRTLQSLGITASTEAIVRHRKHLRARIVPGTNLIEIIYRHDDGVFAINFIDGLIKSENYRRLETRIVLVESMRNSLLEAAQDYHDQLAKATADLFFLHEKELNRASDGEEVIMGESRWSVIFESSPAVVKKRLEIGVAESEIQRIKMRISELDVYRNSLIPPLMEVDSPHISNTNMNDFRIACVILAGFGCLFISASFLLITEHKHG